MKTCPGCDLTLGLNKFYSVKTNVSGVSTYCKLCMDARNRQWRKANYGKYLNYERKYRKQNPIAYMLRRVRCVAKKKGLAFNLRLNDLQKLAVEFCPVFGVRLKYSGIRCARSASVDRINSRRGYVRGNVAIISDRANRIKNDATVRELECIIRYMNRNTGDGL